MSDGLQIVAAATPTLMVLVGILTNNARLNDMNARLSDLRAEMNHRFDDVDGKLAMMAKVWDSELSRVRDDVELLKRR
jgi:hypothetical protein